MVARLVSFLLLFSLCTISVAQDETETNNSTEPVVSEPPGTTIPPPTGQPQISSLEQIDPATQSQVPVGDPLSGSDVDLQCKIDDPNNSGMMYYFEVELVEGTNGFSGIPTHTSDPFPADDVGLIQISNLADGSYKWKARLTDEAGTEYPWKDFPLGQPLADPAFTVGTPPQNGYQTTFDDATGWTLGGLWAVDATPDAFPGGVSMAGNSLNYNNGIDYDTGGVNNGMAVSPPIDVTSFATPKLTFMCNYDTDTAGTGTDERIVSIGGFVLPVEYLTVQLSTTGGSCAAMGTWHSHTIDLDPSWGVVQVKFYFDTVTSADNNHSGWAIDNLTVGENAGAPGVPTSMEQYESDQATVIPVGGQIRQNAVALEASAIDPESDDVKIQFEVRKVGEAFQDTPTIETALFPSGGSQIVDVAGLEWNAAYHWQARTVDATGSMSAWVSFGANGESAPDFEILPQKTHPNGDKTCSAATADGGSLAGLSLTLLMLVALAWVRRLHN